MSKEIVDRLLTSRPKLLFESSEIPVEDELVFEDEDIELEEPESEVDSEVEEELEESSEPLRCTCGSTNIVKENGRDICDDCGRDVSVMNELSEPKVPRVKNKSIKESMNKEECMSKILAYWKAEKYTKAMDLCKKCGITDKEFAKALVGTFRESEEVDDEESLDEELEIIKPEEDSKSLLDKNIIRALQEPVTTADRPNLDSAIIESVSRKIKESIEVDTSRWSYSSGKTKPSGHGIWWFKIGDKEVDFSGMYADSKNKAIQYAKQRGISKIILLP